jgi:hypothetical protein
MFPLFDAICHRSFLALSGFPLQSGLEQFLKASLESYGIFFETPPKGPNWMLIELALRLNKVFKTL